MNEVIESKRRKAEFSLQRNDDLKVADVILRQYPTGSGIQGIRLNWTALGPSTIARARRFRDALTRAIEVGLIWEGELRATSEEESVGLNEVCPACDECRVAALVWSGDDTVVCATCGHEYEPDWQEIECPSSVPDLTCPKCGEGLLAITSDYRALCTKCNEEFPLEEINAAD